ncbi:MAG TPA: PDZ domain-containing protein, partial [Gemmatimonadaceae bacterium]|nr:PDZ domain-containing protein [Gemmatimonadaceae bacterium]
MTRTIRVERRGATWLRTLAVAAVAAAVVTPAVAPVAGAQQRTAAPRPARASAPRAAAGALAELEAARSALAANEKRLRALAVSLAEREMTPVALDSLVSLQRTHQSLAARVRLLEARTRYRATEVEVRSQAARGGPQGWFGVNVTTVAGAGVSPDGRVLVAADYPVIQSVEPGSPAARAGLQAGDRIVAIVGRDLRRENVDLARVLRPGTSVPVHIVRDGRPMDLSVAITARPSSFGPARIVVAAEPPEVGEPPRPPRAPRPARTITRVPVRSSTPAPADVAEIPAPPEALAPPAAPS